MSTDKTSIFTLSRIVVLFTAVLVAVGSGTNYAYSAYSPQLGARLKITHTQLNLIGLAGNIGVYLSGPFWGRIVDHRGPRIPFIAAVLLLLVGYSGIRIIYKNGVPDDIPQLGWGTFALLMLCSFMTGSGGNAGCMAGLNSVAKTFPEKARATATGIVLSGFGLSAFFFSTLAHSLYADDTEGFLLVLSVGTTIPMVVGLIFIHPIPLPASEPHIREEVEAVTAAGIDPESLGLLGDDDSETALLSSDERLEEGASTQDSEYRNRFGSPIHHTYNGLELSPPRSPGRSRSSSKVKKAQGSTSVNIYGKQLFKNGDFWLLFTILSLLSGTGLMYINNVGSMAQSLYGADSLPDWKDAEVVKYQAMQVSMISIMNFSGRIFIGLVSDFAKNRLKFHRSYCLVLVSVLLLISQLTAVSIEHVRDLWKASALLGLGYGSTFGLCPTIAIEWFGIHHFGENWGYVQLSPMIGGNVFSIAFGRNLDAHEPHTGDLPIPEPEPSPTTTSRTIPRLFKRLEPGGTCLIGRECYVDALYLTILGCCIAILLSAWAGWRDRKKHLRKAPGRIDETIE